MKTMSERYPNSKVVKVEVDVPVELLWDIVESGFNGGVYGITQWCNLATPVNENPNYNFKDNLSKQATEWRLRDFEGDGKERPANKVYTMREEDLVKAAKILAEKYPSHFNSIMSLDYDAITGDVLIQCAIFGDIVYC